MTERISSIDELFANAVAAGAHIGGVAIAATADGVIHEAGFGTMTAGGEPVPADTPFRIASMTKALTTTAGLQLVEQGRVDLDAEVASIVPAFGELQVLDGFDGDEPRLRAPASRATVRQLLNHTAGCGYSFLNEKLLRYHEVTGVPNALAFSRSLLELPLVNDPGTQWEYGINTDWAGQVVEAVAGQPLDEYLAEHVFGPLGMEATTFRIDDDAAGRLMPLHSRMEDGSLVPNGVETPRDPEIASGGGGSYSTAADYCRFMRMLLHGGELDGARILEPQTAELMFTPALGDLKLPDVIRSTEPLLTNDIPAPPVPETWGLGLHVVLADLPGMRHAGTGDWAGLTNCYFWIDRTAGVCGAVFTQVLPFFDQGIVETALGFEAGVYTAVGAPAVA
jgi:CubicO group peptidase (beta-lactamase class C family)